MMIFIIYAKYGNLLKEELKKEVNFSKYHSGTQNTIFLFLR